MIVALAREHIDLWWTTLGLGAVVIVVVIVLLSLLVSLVNDIDRNAAHLWSTATMVARNTATTWMLKDTSVAAGVLRDEVELHAQLLKKKVGRK